MNLLVNIYKYSMSSINVYSNKILFMFLIISISQKSEVFSAVFTTKLIQVPTNSTNYVLSQNQSLIKVSEHERTPQCSSKIYCFGPLLHEVNVASIYKDSKTFVDMKMRHTEDEILSKFTAFMEEHNQKPNSEDLKVWVEENFDAPGSEFDQWYPNDWKKMPGFLNNIKDSALREWASDLNYFWMNLGRKMKDDVRVNEHLYSIIYVPNPIIVPGGRFIEFYYWDSYWILKGLMYCEMFSVSKLRHVCSSLPNLTMRNFKILKNTFLDCQRHTWEFPLNSSTVRSHS